MRHDESGIPEAEPQRERRKWRRMPLSWPLRLAPAATCDFTDAESLNISCEGFYCLCRRSFQNSERLNAVIELPVSSPKGSGKGAVFGFAVVVRVEPQDDGLYGVACKLKDWRLGSLQED